MTVVTIQQRRATSTEWSTKNPILKAGEIGFEIDTGKIKCGNGITPWNELVYISGDVNAVQNTGQSTTQVMSQKAVTDELEGKVDKEVGKGLIEPAPVDGKEYARKDGTWVEVVGGGGGASALADLTDVDFGTPTDGQVLTYDAATQKSKFTDQAGGGGDVEEAPLDGKLYGRKDGTWVVAPSPVDVLLDFSAGTDKFLLNSDFPDDTKRYSGRVQLLGLPMRYVATPLIGYPGGAATLGRHIEYSSLYDSIHLKIYYLILKDTGIGSESYVPILNGGELGSGVLTQLNNLTGDFSVTEGSFYFIDVTDLRLHHLTLSIPAGLEGQILSVSETGAGVGFDFDPLGLSPIPLDPVTADTPLRELLDKKPLYNGVDSSGFEYKVWFRRSPATIYFETQNPNQHTLDIFF